MYELGITSGYEDGTYRPTLAMDRGMAAVFFVRAWSYKTYGSPNGFPDAPLGDYNGSTFIDVPTSHPFFRWIQKLAQLGITSGCGWDDWGRLKYCPADSVSNLSASVFSVRTAQITVGNPQYTGFISETFTNHSAEAYFLADAPPGSGRYNYVQRVRDAGVIGTGCAERSFCPYNAISRGDISYYVVRGPLNEFMVTRPANESQGSSRWVWEPSIARGQNSPYGSMFAAVSNELGVGTTPSILRVANWDPAPSQKRWEWSTLASSTGDPYVVWDRTRNRFVMVALWVDSGDIGHIYYAESNSAGSSWTWRSAAVLPGSFSGSMSWDYPSVAVDNNGRIMVGAVRFSTGGFVQPVGFYTTLSTDGGVTFGPPVEVVNASSAGGGHKSRVIGGNGRFHIFAPILFDHLAPTGMVRYESMDGASWTSWTLWTNPTAPPNDSLTSLGQRACTPGTNELTPGNDCLPLWYSGSHPDSYGDPVSGRWSVVGLVNNYGNANVYMCTSDRGCGLVNPSPYDQFLASTAISDDGTYWVNYHTFTTSGVPANSTPPSNVFAQIIAYPPGQSGVGDTVIQGTAPATWAPVLGRCAGSCYAGGDYAKMAPSHDSRASAMPYLRQEYAKNNDLFSLFLRNPTGSAFYAPLSTSPADLPADEKPARSAAANAAGVGTMFDPPALLPIAAGSTPFRPNFSPYPVGSNLAHIGKSVPHPSLPAIGVRYMNKLRLINGKDRLQP